MLLLVLAVDRWAGIDHILELCIVDSCVWQLIVPLCRDLECNDERRAFQFFVG